MSTPTRWLKTLFRAAHRRRFEDELDQELRFHVDMEIESLVAKGHSPEDARRLAERSFGRIEAHKDEVRDARGLTLVDDVGRDVRFGLRTMWRNRSFVAVALLCIGLGIGANAAVFSVINAVLLRPLPYGSPEGLVRIYETQPQRGGGWRGSVSVLNYEDFAQQLGTLQDVTAFEVGSKNLSGEEAAERIRVVGATSGFFRLLRVRPMLGRGFAAGEDQPGQARVTVLSESLWRRRFGASPTILSRTVTLDGQPYQVIGVISDLFTFPGREHADAFVPLEVSEERRKNRGTHYLGVIARLRPGMTLGQANADSKTVARRIEMDHPQEQTGRSAETLPLLDTVVSGVRPTLLVLLGAVTLVLLIACANVANLLLARAAGRQQEMALRHALGASRARLVGQLLVESIVLAVAGAAVGLVLATLGLKALQAALSTGLPLAGGIQLDARVLLFTLGLSVLTAVLFGLAPAVQITGDTVRSRMSEGEHGSSGRHHRLRSVLVTAEVALSLVLLVGAGLLVRSFHTLLQTDPGVRTGGLLSAHLPIPKDKYPGSELQTRLLRPVLENVRAIPGVEAAGVISMLPIQQAWTNGDFQVEGEPSPPPGLAPIAEMRVTSPGTFAALGIPILKGRDFLEDDGTSQVHPVIVNRTLAAQHFRDGNVLGRRLIIDNVPCTIVGVVGDVRQAGLDQPPLAEIHFPYGNPEDASWLTDVTLVLRTRLDPVAAAGSLRAAVHAVSSDQPLYDVLTMDDVISRSVASRRLSLVLLSVFAVLAVALSAAGLYGVISYLVAQRTREIGIRMALGSEPADVVRLLLRQGSRLVALGLVLGVLGAVLAGRFLLRVLTGLQAPDVTMVGGLAAFLGGVALLATYLPARRAARVDPLIAIRAE